jgi:outer membrane protein assembly factor BamB
MGPNRDGNASFNPPSSWPSELSQKWKVTVGEGVATPALVGDKLYVFSRQDNGEVIRCLNAATGEEIWKDRMDVLPADGPARGFSGPRSTPAVAEGKVVTLGLRGTVSCYDAASGKLLWRKEDFKGSWPRFFTSASPIIADGMCIAQLGAGDSGGVIAYDLANGNEKWRWEGEGPAYASTMLLGSEGGKLVIAETESKIVGLALASGKLLWETPFPLQGRGGYNASTPVAVGNTLIYAGSGRGVTMVKLAKSGDSYSATEVWKNMDNSVQFNTPIMKDGAVYGLSADNQFFCIAPDGKTAWTAPLSGSDAGEQQGGRRGRGRGGYGSIVDAGSVMLALTPASELIAFEPGTSAYKEVARIKVADSPTHAYPVVSGKRIFIKDENDLMLYTVP